MTTAAIIGTAASIFVAGAMMLSSILWLRRVSVLGNVSFMVYGAMIGAWPVVATNAFICVTNIYYLILLGRTRQDFSVVPVRAADDDWLRAFLGRFGDDISKRYPGFAAPDPSTSSRVRGAFIVRNAAPIGLLLYRHETDGRARILADYVIPGYRDFRPAHFLYDRGSDWLRDHGVTELVVTPPDDWWHDYFRRFGFEPDDGRDLRYPVTTG